MANAHAIPSYFPFLPRNGKSHAEVNKWRDGELRWTRLLMSSWLDCQRSIKQLTWRQCRIWKWPWTVALVWSSSVTRLIARSASVLLDCTLCWLLPAPFFYRWPESTLSILDVHSIFTTCNYEKKVAISEASLAVRSWTMMIMSFFLLEGHRAESPSFLHVEFRCCKFHFSQTFVLFALLILHFRLLLSLSLVLLPWGALLVPVEVPSGYYQRGHGLNYHLPWFSSFVWYLKSSAGRSSLQHFVAVDSNWKQ